MNKKSSITALSYLILCMLRRKPQSGYRLCKSIEAMPIGAISSSPGSIYPCLKNLEESGHILTKVTGGTVKPRKLFRISASGKRILAEWFSEPMNADSVIRSPAMLFTKLSFIDPGDEEMSKLLTNLKGDLSARKKSLSEYKKASEAGMHIGGQLAMDLSIQMVAVMERWAANAAIKVKL